MPTLSTIRQSSFGAAVGEGYRWWVEELAAMVPRRIAARRSTIGSSTLRVSRSACVVDRVMAGNGQRFVDARPLDAFDDKGWADLAALLNGTRAILVLESPDCFVTSVVLPKAAKRRLRAAVTLQLAQIAPLDPLMLEWGMRVASQAENHIIVQVAMVRSSAIDALKSLFEINGVAPPPIHAHTPEASIELAPGHDYRISPAARDLRRAMMLGCAMLATIPFSLLAGAALLTATTRDRAESLQKELGPKVVAERRLRREENLKRVLRPVLQRPAVSDTLERLAARLPMTAYLRTIEQGANRSLTFTVDTADPEATGSALGHMRALPGLELIDQTAGNDGRMTVQYRTSPR